MSVRLLRYYRFLETDMGVRWLGMTAAGTLSFGGTYLKMIYGGYTLKGYPV